MVSINYSSREVSCKIVYYGPGLSGKTTNLQYVHAKVPKKTRGDLISLATDADRTLYFDFLPINIGTINGFATKFQLYTVPGQVFYNATRKLVLRGVDGLVFVADSQRSKREENIESLNNLKENLVEYGYDINTLPIVLQYNKRDLPEVMTIAELEQDLNWNNLAYFEASAVKGHGVFDTLKMITKLVLNKARKGAEQSSSPTPTTTSRDAERQQSDVASQVSPAAAPVEMRRTDTPIPSEEQSEHLAALETNVAVASDKAPEFSVPRRVAVSRVEESDGTRLTDTDSTRVDSISDTSLKSLAEIESKLQPIADDHSFQSPSGSTQAAGVADTSESASRFADTFEVPRMVGMQKSLKVKKKKRKFFLFRWFSRDKA